MNEHLKVNVLLLLCLLLPSEMSNYDLQHLEILVGKFVHVIVDVIDAKHLLLN